jgi:hypothetical protein
MEDSSDLVPEIDYPTTFQAVDEWFRSACRAVAVGPAVANVEFSHPPPNWSEANTLLSLFGSSGRLRPTRCDVAHALRTTLLNVDRSGRQDAELAGAIGLAFIAADKRHGAFHHEEPRVEIMGVRLASFAGLDLAFVDCVSIPAGIGLKIGSVHSAICLPVYLFNLTRCACRYKPALTNRGKPASATSRNNRIG